MKGSVYNSVVTLVLQMKFDLLNHKALSIFFCHLTGGAPQAGVVRTVRSQRQPMFDAPSRSAPDRRRWTARIPHVRRSSCTIHGPH